MATLCRKMDDNDVSAANLLSSTCSSGLPPVSIVNSDTPSRSAVPEQVNPPGFVKNIPKEGDSHISNQLSHSSLSTLAVQGFVSSQLDWLETQPADLAPSSTFRDPASIKFEPVSNGGFSYPRLPVAEQMVVDPSIKKGEVSDISIGNNHMINNVVDFTYQVNRNDNILNNTTGIETSNYSNVIDLVDTDHTCKIPTTNTIEYTNKKHNIISPYDTLSFDIRNKQHKLLYYCDAHLAHALLSYDNLDLVWAPYLHYLIVNYADYLLFDSFLSYTKPDQVLASANTIEVNNKRFYDDLGCNSLHSFQDPRVLSAANNQFKKQYSMSHQDNNQYYDHVPLIASNDETLEETSYSSCTLHVKTPHLKVTGDVLTGILMSDALESFGLNPVSSAVKTNADDTDDDAVESPNQINMRINTAINSEVQGTLPDGQSEKVNNVHNEYKINNNTSGNTPKRLSTYYSLGIMVSS